MLYEFIRHYGIHIVLIFSGCYYGIVYREYGYALFPFLPNPQATPVQYDCAFDGLQGP